MFKIIITLAALFLVGFLVVNDHWLITVTGFGYEITVSTVLILLVLLALLYLVHLIKCPVRWAGKLKGKCSLSKQTKREEYYIQIMKAILSNNTAEMQLLAKKKNTCFDKKDTRNLLIDALLQPNKETFEALSKNKETELAGLNGLYAEAHKAGDIKEQERILQIAEQNYANIPWVIREQFEISLLQYDWEKATEKLETLKKQKLISKTEYQKGHAGLLLKTGHPKEAYEADKTNPAFALAYAADDSKKAADILLASWRSMPCWETYQAYMNLFKDETAAKQMKAVKKLVSKNSETRIALLATVDTCIKLELWREAKETMEIYMQAYPLTKQAAELMATIVRKGWHHEEEAREWERKPVESDDKIGWQCTHCNHKTYSWDITCPNCNAFGAITYR